MRTSFWKAGHLPTLFASFLYFDLSFMVWVLLGPLAIPIANELNLTAVQKGFMVATPLLAGALLRIVMGVLVDHLQPKKAGWLGQIVVLAALLWAWRGDIHSYEHILALGALLGVAGAAFAVALPLASRWYPAEHQGTALGIAGAGNSGTALAALFAPALAIAFGWRSVFGLCLLPLGVALIVYTLFAKDAPNPPEAKPLHRYLEVLKDRDAWWFMFFYCVSFGGFSGLASSLTLYFHTQYNVSPVMAGYFTAACVFAGSLVRPFGGRLADRIGGTTTLSMTYLAASTFLYLSSLNLPIKFALLVFVFAMLSLGTANGAVFQLVPQRFKREMGVMTGLVGMAGGIGGFYLAASLGYSVQTTGSYRLGLAGFAALALVALVSLTFVKSRWRNTWGSIETSGAKV